MWESRETRASLPPRKFAFFWLQEPWDFYALVTFYMISCLYMGKHGYRPCMTACEVLLCLSFFLSSGFNRYCRPWFVSLYNIWPALKKSRVIIGSALFPTRHAILSSSQSPPWSDDRRAAYSSMFRRVLTMSATKKGTLDSFFTVSSKKRSSSRQTGQFEERPPKKARTEVEAPIAPEAPLSLSNDEKSFDMQDLGLSEFAVGIVNGLADLRWRQAMQVTWPTFYLAPAFSFSCYDK